jgi:hypothetical protein
MVLTARMQTIAQRRTNDCGQHASVGVAVQRSALLPLAASDVGVAVVVSMRLIAKQSVGLVARSRQSAADQ